MTAAGEARLQKAILWSTTLLLVVAPLAGSAGSRTTLLIVAAAALALLHWRGPRPEREAVPGALLAAFAAWALLATASLGWSVQPAYTRGELRAEVLYGALALGVFLLAGREVSRWPAWRGALLFGWLLIAFVHLLQQVLPFALSRHALDGQGGLWSTHLVLVAPLLLTIAWPPPWGAARGAVLQAAVVLLLFADAWETANRAVWFAFAVQIAVAMALSARVASGDPVRLRAFRRVAILAVLLVAVALVATTRERIELARPGLEMGAALAADLRPHIWSAAWTHFLEAPWLGHGFGRGILGPTFAALTPSTGAHPPVEHAHNLFIDIALQLGVAGLLAFLAILAALAREYLACLRDARLAHLGILGFTLLAGFLAKNLTDDFLHRHNAIVFWAMNGLLVGLASFRRRALDGPGAKRARLLRHNPSMARFHFVEDYERLVANLIRKYPLDEAMAHAVGGNYELFGKIEAGMLRALGLRDGMRVVDLGCGSGRLPTALHGSLKISYFGTDIIPALLEYAKSKAPTYEFRCHRELSIPQHDASADMVTAFSLFTHLLHAETYIYLQEAVRVLKPGGAVVFSFLEFAEPYHWPTFEVTREATRTGTSDHLNMFIERPAIEVWARRLGLGVERYVGALEPLGGDHALGQSVVVLRKPA